MDNYINKFNGLSNVTFIVSYLKLDLVVLEISIKR
jgi:hypothetical protein